MKKRYFYEVSYHGAGYRGFQKQENAKTIQSELETALGILHRREFTLTGSSRTDAGVHALQNYFHSDEEEAFTPHTAYKLNAILPPEIAVRGIYEVPEHWHSRFSATARTYQYTLYTQKNPFLRDRAYYYPYPLVLEKLEEVCAVIRGENDFQAFSKRNTQVHHFVCNLMEARWEEIENGFRFWVTGNRFLRGMVRALVGTSLKVGRGVIGIDDFETILRGKDCTKSDFSAPAQGLCLMNVHFPLELSGLLTKG
jgi:tRNA pseudouridine38-40 synthase